TALRRHLEPPAFRRRRKLVPPRPDQHPPGRQEKQGVLAGLKRRLRLVSGLELPPTPKQREPAFALPQHQRGLPLSLRGGSLRLVPLPQGAQELGGECVQRGSLLRHRTSLLPGRF